MKERLRGVDANLLLYAVDSTSAHHRAAQSWLEGAINGTEQVGLPWPSLLAFVRIVTHPRIFRDPTPLADALEFATVMRAAPAAVTVAPGPRHWALFEQLCTTTEARGNSVPDAYLAALAIEQGTTWYTCDRSFARFPGLRWEHPLDG